MAEAVIYLIEGLPGRDGSSFDPRQYMPESPAPRSLGLREPSSM